MGNQGSFYQGFDHQQQFVNPTGLYGNKNKSSSGWPINDAKKLILSKKIAPRYPGTSSEKLSMKYGIKKGVDTKSAWEECPICFRFYPEVNISICCSQKICSECYLHITQPNKISDCSFCFTRNFTVMYLPSPHGREAAIHEMVECMREDGNKSWELEDGEVSDHLDTASVDTMKELQRESVKQAYQAEADRARMSLANHNLSKKNVLESYIPDDILSISSGSIGSPMMSPGRLEEIMLIQAIEASLKLDEEEKRKTTTNANNNVNGNGNTAQMLVSPMLYPTKPGPSSTMDSLSSSAMPITSPLTFAQRNEKSLIFSLSSSSSSSTATSVDTIPALSLPPPSKSSTPSSFQ